MVRVDQNPAFAYPSRLLCFEEKSNKPKRRWTIFENWWRQGRNIQRHAPFMFTKISPSYVSLSRRAISTYALVLRNVCRLLSLYFLNGRKRQKSPCDCKISPICYVSGVIRCTFQEWHSVNDQIEENQWCRTSHALTYRKNFIVNTRLKRICWIQNSTSFGDIQSISTLANYLECSLEKDFLEQRATS